MPSTLSWLDHDTRERDRTNRILALFTESDTRDELGLGAIRDSFSDQLFPGTSTVLTRLRYMLFIPWMYRYFESRPDASAQLAKRGRDFEIQMIMPLLDGDDRSGVFGRRAKGGLKTLPSTIYWAGLCKWGICRWRQSQGHYHQRLDDVARNKRSLRLLEDGSLPDDNRDAWHNKIPNPPAAFPKQLDFQLTREEADFILDRLRGTCKGSLLTHLAENWDGSDVPFPWQHPGLHDFRNQELVRQARLFSETMYGAALLYNHLLARLSNREFDYSENLDEWADRLDFGEVAAWNLNHFWTIAQGYEHQITLPTKKFVEEWIGLVISHRKSVVDNKQAAALIEQRERRLKGNRSRFQDARARDRWNGASGAWQMSYRWYNTKRLLNDLNSGLGKK